MGDFDEEGFLKLVFLYKFLWIKIIEDMEMYKDVNMLERIGYLKKNIFF